MTFIKSLTREYIDLLKPLLRTSKKSFLILLTLIIGIVTASSIYVYATTATNAHNRGLIAFIGDSNITLQSATIDWLTTWKSHNNNSYTPVFISRVGSGIRTEDCLNPTGCTTYNFWQIKLGETLPKVQADAFVVDLGINDTLSPGTETTPGYSNYGKKIDWMMSLFPTNRQVLWTNLPCNIEPSVRLTGCNAVNFALGMEAQRWPNMKVLNWAYVANSHPEYMSGDGSPTDVHYSGVGAAAWTNFVLQYLDPMFPVPSS